ncbi:MAG: hypothetical protein RR307_00520 [Clostridia bacterium]
MTQIHKNRITEIENFINQYLNFNNDYTKTENIIVGNKFNSSNEKQNKNIDMKILPACRQTALSEETYKISKQEEFQNKAQKNVEKEDIKKVDIKKVDIKNETVQENIKKEKTNLFSATANEKERTLEDFINRNTSENTFSTMLLRLIDERGLKDSDVYKKAYIDRRHFSKIRSKNDYKPTKITVFAFALALNLNEDETLDLLNSAGFNLCYSSRFDLIILYHIQMKIFDLNDVNQSLIDLGENPIGCDD